MDIGICQALIFKHFIAFYLCLHLARLNKFIVNLTPFWFILKHGFDNISSFTLVFSRPLLIKAICALGTIGEIV